MSQISVGADKQPRIPAAVSGVDVNRCANPRCENFNVPATQKRNDPAYKISGNKKNGSSLVCRKCGGFVSVKSNKAIHEELSRIAETPIIAKILRQDGVACPNTKCTNFALPQKNFPELYKLNGKTSVGNQRYKCLKCARTFTSNSRKRTSHPQSKRYLNHITFMLFVNGINLNRAHEILDLDLRTIYRKLDMFYERCLYFSRSREERLKSMDLGLVRLSTDRQEFHVNWSDRHDRKQSIMNAIGTADVASGYVFGMDVNYDPSMQMSDVVESEEYKNDGRLKDYNRHYARIWTERDMTVAINVTGTYQQYKTALIQRYREFDLPVSDIAIDDIANSLAAEYGIEPTEQDKSTKLPTKGVQVHSEYTMYAHFYNLNNLLGHAQQLRFYLDQEPAINRACHMAFSKAVTEHRLQSLYIKIDKTLKIDERRELVRMSNAVIEQVRKEQSLDKYEAQLMLAKNGLQTMIKLENSRADYWYELPIDKIYECRKMVSFLTRYNELSETVQAKIFLDASLHPIDRFFQRVRRRLSALERPISTSSNPGRIWTGKSPYNPIMITKFTEILRTYHNYCLTIEGTGKTPAEMMGLAKGKVEIRKILYPEV